MSTLWPDIFAGFLLIGLTLYAITGGADFGGGVWDLLARGPRAAAQRRLIDAAIAPVWEANHVWLIFVVVLLFTAFPSAFSAASIGLHLPLVLMLLGITLRGAAFVFRHYGEGPSATRWGKVFAIASTATPILLGMVLGAVTRGVHSTGGNLYASVADWTAPFALAVGAFTLSLFAHLAAVFLAADAEDPMLRRDFQRRAWGSGVVALFLGVVCMLTADAPMARFSHRLVGSWWSLPLGALTAATTVVTFASLRAGRWRAARWAAIAQVIGVIGGWGAAHYPLLLAPGFTIASSASPTITLQWVAPVVGAGSAILVPSLFWLLRTFKAGQRDPDRPVLNAIDRTTSRW